MWSERLNLKIIIFVKLFLSAIFIISLINSVVATETTDNLVWSYKTSGSINSVSISTDGYYISAGSKDKIVYLFNNEGEKLWSYEIDDSINKVAISKKGVFIAAIGNNTVHFFNHDGEKLWSYNINNYIHEVVISNNGFYLIIMSHDGDAYYFNHDGKILWSFKPDDFGTTGIAISDDGSHAVITSPHRIYLFNRNGENIWAYSNFDSGIKNVAISSDNSYIVIGNNGYNSGNVYLFTLDGELLWGYDSDPICSVAISDDGFYVVAGSEYGNVYLFNRDGEIIWKYMNNRGNPCLFSVFISSDGSYVATSEMIESTRVSGDTGTSIYEGKIILFNHDGEKIWTYNPNKNVESVSISANHLYIAAGIENDIYLFNRNYTPTIQQSTHIEETSGMSSTFDDNYKYSVFFVGLVSVIYLGIVLIKRRLRKSSSEVNKIMQNETNIIPTKHKRDKSFNHIENSESNISISRETEFYQGFIRLKMSITNTTIFVINDVNIDFYFDEVLLRMDRYEPDYPIKNGKIIIGNINNSLSKSVAVYFDPMMCSKGTEIKCQINYGDAKGHIQTTWMEPKRINVVCPIIKTDSDINIGRLKEFVKKLPNRDSKIFQIHTGFNIDSLKTISQGVIQKHNVKHIRSLHTKDGKTCEIWYYGKTKINNYDIVIKITISSKNQSIELFAATQTAESLTGLLAEFGRELLLAIEAKITGKNNVNQVINVSIKDSIIQRSNLLSYCDIDGKCTGDVIVEDSLVQRSDIGLNAKANDRFIQKTDVSGSSCPVCGGAVPDGAKFCNECGGKLK